jgi:formylglycine-generating enzyme required for sulfatase activity
MKNQKTTLLVLAAAFLLILLITYFVYDTHYKPMASLEQNMVFIKGGTFMMGDKVNAPIHEVALSDFYIGRYEVTQKEWGEVMGNSPSAFKGADMPVEQVSWDDIQIFLRRLNEKTGKNYSLPTEAQWEYAAKGGDYFVYSGSESVEEVAWYAENSGNTTHPVGQKKANGYGLYDMNGNVWEWCQDEYNEDYYQECKNKGVVTNLIYQGSGSNHVSRGGSWLCLAAYCTSALRRYYAPSHNYEDLGFRLSRAE